MFQTHYPALVGAYATALVGWWIVQSLVRLWPVSKSPAFEHPLREFFYALLGGVGVILLGMLWSRGIRLPETGTLAPLVSAVNQLWIFLPAFLVPVIRRQPRDTFWWGGNGTMYRVALGLILAAIAVSAYAFLREGAARPWTILGRTLTYEHLGDLVQVICEDFLIALLLVRLGAKIGAVWAALLVAVLFAAGHIPALLANGASLNELASLAIDFVLAAGIFLTLARARDILWFIPIHFILDMLQFDPVALAH